MKKLRLWTTATISCAHLLRLRGLRTPSACPTPLGTWNDVGCVPPQCNSELSHCVRFCNRKERAETPIKNILHCRSYRLDFAVLTSKGFSRSSNQRNLFEQAYTKIDHFVHHSLSFLLWQPSIQLLGWSDVCTSLLNSNPLLTKNWGQ